MSSRAHSLTTCDAWEAAKRDADVSGVPLVLQITSATCVRCPAVHDAIADASDSFTFTSAFCNAHSPENELVDEFVVTMLPTVVVYDPREPDARFQRQAISAEETTAAIAAMCRPKLRLDEEF